MDKYEKLYNEALERARGLLEIVKEDKVEITEEDVKSLFPELRESEEERIRKELVQFLTDVKNISEGGRDSWHVRKEDAEMCDSFLTYLEKQKEQKPAECIPDSVKFDEGFKTGREVGFREGVESVKAAELTPLATLLSNYLKNDFEYFATKKWDEKKWNEVMNIQASELLRTAKNELEQEQKPAWSEEDEKMLRTIISDGSRCVELDSKQIAWLKSLRPSWKPSEEQMDALHTAVYLEEMQFYGGLKDKLRVLYEQLKKL